MYHSLCTYPAVVRVVKVVVVRQLGGHQQPSQQQAVHGEGGGQHGGVALGGGEGREGGREGEGQ